MYKIIYSKPFGHYPITAVAASAADAFDKSRQLEKAGYTANVWEVTDKGAKLVKEEQ